MKITSQKIFITGGAGFIASHLLERLLRDTDSVVTVYDNLNRDAIRYTSLRENPRVRFVQGDILDFDCVADAMKGTDICIHAAAIAGIYSVGNNLSRTIKVNLMGTYNALEAALHNGVNRFVDFSTSEIYGPYIFRGNENEPATVGPPSERRWIYAVSKLAAEHLTHAYGADFGLNVSTVRPFNVYGPRQVGEGAIQQMTLKALAGEDITVYNDGTQIRSWCHVDDFVDGLVRVIESENACGEAFNIGNPNSTTTILNLAQMIIRITGTKSKIVFKPHPGPEVEMRVPDVGKARTLLGFNPSVDLETGLSSTIDWYRDYAVQ
jgi:UDP-glucose 4-epimerase